MKNIKKNVGKNMGKKASIGTGFAWVPALFIISFIMIIFVAVVGAKGFFERNDSKIKIIEGSNGEIILTKSFISFLDEKIEGKKVKELIKEFGDGVDNKEIIQNKFDNFLKESDFECSIIDISLGDKQLLRILDLANSKQSPSLDLQQNFLDKGIVLYLISEKNNLIKINIYAGECKNGYF